MQCSICKKEASYIIPQRNNKEIIYYEGRCKEHKSLGRLEERRRRINREKI